MKKITVVSIVAALTVLSRQGVHAQGTGSDVYWRIDPSVKSCSMVIDPSLTQAQWRTYVKQVGEIAAFKSLASAEPLGAMRFSVGIDYSNTPVNQHDPAWINTFVHPDAECPLGDAIAVPTLFARMGVTDNMDIYSIEALASKNISFLTPYVGFRGSLAVGTETTSKVDLSQERVLLPQAYAGLSYSVWVLNLAAEYNISNVNTFAFAAGVRI